MVDHQKYIPGPSYFSEGGIQTRTTVLVQPLKDFNNWPAYIFYPILIGYYIGNSTHAANHAENMKKKNFMNRMNLQYDLGFFGVPKIVYIFAVILFQKFDAFF